MKRKISLLVIYTLLILCFLSSAVSADTDVIVTGRIQIFALDKNDYVIKLSIENENERYVLHVESIGEDLLELIGSEVQLTGTLGPDEEGNKTIHVKTYERIIYKD